MKRVTALAVMFALTASPALGVQCTMSCSDDGSACCCSPGSAVQELSYSSPSCCQPEFQEQAAGNLILPDRVAGRARTSPLPLAAPQSLHGAEGSSDTLAGVCSTCGPPPARSYPLFVLNAAFLI